MSVHGWKLIKGKEEYDAAMDRFLQLASGDLVPDTDDYDEFELLNLLIGHYEKVNYPLKKPSPLEAIKFRMDQMGMTQNDMTEYLGSKSKVSEVLSGKRKLSLTMIKRLHDGLGIPLDVLIQDSSSVDEWCKVSPKNATTEQHNYVMFESADLLKILYTENFSDNETIAHSNALIHEHIINVQIADLSCKATGFSKRQTSRMAMAIKNKSMEINHNQIDDNEYSLVNYENNFNSEIGCQRIH
ncbi:MAG: helix-turn-helix domain-containing protein [Pantoea sp.]|uniref:helix-turn-helix domain-containing protein n=1 Tax=Pantoea sp. TaxID=69393 RepID=UPI0039E3287F